MSGNFYECCLMTEKNIEEYKKYILNEKLIFNDVLYGYKAEKEYISITNQQGHTVMRLKESLKEDFYRILEGNVCRDTRLKNSAYIFKTLKIFIEEGSGEKVN